MALRMRTRVCWCVHLISASEGRWLLGLVLDGEVLVRFFWKAVIDYTPPALLHQNSGIPNPFNFPTFLSSSLIIPSV